MGYDGAEFDVRFSRDGVAVIVHDESLARTHGDDRAVGRLEAVELQRLGVPSLIDVLGTLPATQFLDIELKEAPLPDFFRALRAWCRETSARFVISSFHEHALREVGLRAPEWSRWLNVETPYADLETRALKLGVDGVALEKSLLTSGRSAGLESRGLERAVWTLRTREDLSYLAVPGLVAACVEGEAR